MKSLAELSADAGRQLIGVFTDIDDTLTTDGQLTAAAYNAMERLRDSGLAVVPITGRPAGWCDLIARLWPVDGVVGENGAFYFHYDRGNRKMCRYYADDVESRRDNSERLMALGDAVLSAVPGPASRLTRPIARPIWRSTFARMSRLWTSRPLRRLLLFSRKVGRR